MKRIFPIITFLITLSLLGLIFFQYLWLRSARDIKVQQLEENIIKATGEAASRMVDENVPIPLKKKPFSFGQEKFLIDLKNLIDEKIKSEEKLFNTDKVEFQYISDELSIILEWFKKHLADRAFKIKK